MFSLKIPSVLNNRSLLILLTARISTSIAFQMLTVAVGWQIYSITQMPIYLGLVGLVQFLPMLLLTLVVGYVADRYNRKLIICLSQIVESIGIFLLAYQSHIGSINEEGILYTFGPEAVYIVAGILAMVTSLIILFVSIREKSQNSDPVSINSIFGGIAFIRNKPAILGAISLDLFAVLFGGATALLPIYASNILKIGPLGLGLLRSAPAIGALVMSAFLAKMPLKRNEGYKMFIAVIFFGIFTMIFALSTSFVLSLASLVLLGAADVVSVVVRLTLIQLETPDNMRGRVNAVNSMFIGTSNQLGEFESGLTASLFGVVPAVLLGGVGSIIVAILWMKLFPELLHATNLGKSLKSS